MIDNIQLAVHQTVHPQLTQNLLNDRKERPKLLAVARRMIPDILRAAEAMCHLRGYVTGEW